MQQCTFPTVFKTHLKDAFISYIVYLSNFNVQSFTMKPKTCQCTSKVPVFIRNVIQIQYMRVVKNFFEWLLLVRFLYVEKNHNSTICHGMPCILKESITNLIKAWFYDLKNMKYLLKTVLII